MSMSHNAPIIERLKYDRENISPAEWEDIAADLQLMEQLREALWDEENNCSSEAERERLLREIAR